MLRIILVLAAMLTGCASREYCGLPCDQGGQAYVEPAPPKPKKNRYGTIYGAMEVSAMGIEELLLEKKDLEMVLSQNQEDYKVLQAMAERDRGTYRTEVQGSRVGNSYYGTATTTREDSWEDLGRNIALSRKRSRNRRLFDRYREVTLTLERIRIERAKAAAQEQSAPQPVQVQQPGMVEIK